jgi:hypothetical protein
VHRRLLLRVGFFDPCIAYDDSRCKQSAFEKIAENLPEIALTGNRS